MKMITREQLIRKLTQRKFAAGVIGFIVPILVAFKVPDLTIEQVVAVVSGVFGLIAFIFGEAYVDGQRVRGEYDEDKTTE